MKGNSFTRILILVALLIATCAGVSYFMSSLVLDSREWGHDDAHGHQWLHKELGLSPEEAERIDYFEGGYRARREALLKEFNLKMSELAVLLRDTETYSDDVTKAVHELHRVHGDLQTLSIEHYYEMLSVLPPDKQGKLKELAVEALSQPE